MAESHEDARSVARKEGVLVIIPERRYFNGMKANFEALEERRRIGVLASEGFSEFLREYGYDFEDVVSCGARDPMMGYRMPRNIPWKEFPVVRRPDIDYAIHGLTHYRVRPTSSFWQAATSSEVAPRHFKLSHFPVELADIVDLVVIDGIEDTDRIIRQHTVMFDHLEFSDLPRFFAYRDGVITPIDRERVFSLRSKFEAQERFDSAHALNASVLVGRALLDLGKRMKLPRGWLDTVPITGGSRPYATPLAIQVLFDLKRRVEITGTAPPAPKRSFFDNNELVFKSGHVTGLDNEGLPVFEWAGTGKYPAWTISGHQEISELSWMYASFISMGLIGVAADGALAITERGLALVETFGRDGDDPDVLLRWRDSEGVNGSQSSIKAMDRWLSRFFRATKRKVASMPAWGHVEAGGEVDPVLCAERYAFGTSIALSPEDLEDAEVAEYIRQIEGKTSGKPWWTSDVGIIRDRTRLGEPQVTGIWWGVPLGVDVGKAAIVEYGLPKMRPVRYGEEHRHLPERFYGNCGGTRDIIECGSTFEMPYRLFEVHGATDGPFPKNSGVVLRGWHLFVDDLSSLPKEARNLIGSLATRPENRLDPHWTTFRITRSAAGLHVVVGLLVKCSTNWGFTRSPHYDSAGMVAFIRERYRPLLELSGISRLSSWLIDDATPDVVTETDLFDERTGELDTILTAEDTRVIPPSH